MPADQNRTPEYRYNGDVKLMQSISGARDHGEAVPFWIVAAGEKYNFTARWWAHERYQGVVDHFAGRTLFEQVGEAGHHHPPLRNVLDLRGRTDLRQLVRLVHHAQGVLCPVTLLMHLLERREACKTLISATECW